MTEEIKNLLAKAREAVDAGNALASKTPGVVGE